MRSCPGGIYIAPEVVRLLLTVVAVSPQVVHTYLAFVGYQCGVQVQVCGVLLGLQLGRY